MVEVERWWFRMHATRDEIGFPYDPEGIGLDFEEIEEADSEADLAAFRSECEAARAAVAGRGFDDVVPSRGHHPERERDIRWILCT
jgi:hypothetical protein